MVYINIMYKLNSVNPSPVFARYGKIQDAMIINMNKKVVFKKRIPEPKEMRKEEMMVFESDLLVIG